MDIAVDAAIPDAWPAAVLVLGAYRVTRFLGWDDWPPIARVRAWVIGERWVADLPDEPLAQLVAMEESDRGLEAHIELPGKTPSSEADAVRPAYDRPTLAHLVQCPFCLGAWVSLATWAAWNVTETWTLWSLAPFALSGAVGLIAKNLDP